MRSITWEFPVVLPSKGEGGAHSRRGAPDRRRRGWGYGAGASGATPEDPFRLQCNELQHATRKLRLPSDIPTGVHLSFPLNFRKNQFFALWEKATRPDTDDTVGKRGEKMNLK